MVIRLHVCGAADTLVRRLVVDRRLFNGIAACANAIFAASTATTFTAATNFDAAANDSASSPPPPPAPSTSRARSSWGGWPSPARPPPPAPSPPPPPPPPSILPPPIRQQTTDLTITVPTLRALGQPIAPNFIGLSLELFGVHYYLNSKVATLLRELRSLTPGAQPGPVLRIGGGSADASCFVDAGPMPLGCGHRITRADLAEYAAFAAREPDLNLSYVIDVNFGRSPSPDLAVAHVKALRETSGLWPLVKAIEIGNEQDHYARLTPQEQRSGGAAHRSMTYHYEEYAADFAAYIAALRGAGLPKRRIQGGTWCCAPNRMDEERGGRLCWRIPRQRQQLFEALASELLSILVSSLPHQPLRRRMVTPSELLADHASIGMAECTLWRLSPPLPRAVVSSLLWVRATRSLAAVFLASLTFCVGTVGARLSLLAIKGGCAPVQLPRRTGRGVHANRVWKGRLA